MHAPVTDFTHPGTLFLLNEIMSSISRGPTPRHGPTPPQQKPATPRKAPATPRDKSGRFRLAASPRRQHHLATPVGSSWPPADDLEFGGVVRPGGRRLQNPELPIEYLDYAARLQRVSKAAAREELERRAAAAAIADVAKKSPRKPPGPPRSRAQVVGLAEMLSAASDCEALLSGALQPQQFAETVSSMGSREEMARWVSAFGTCVSRLGRTLQDLHGQLNKLMRSQKRSRLQVQAREVLRKVEVVEDAFDSLDATSRTAGPTAAEAVTAQLAAASRTLCHQPVKCTRLWTRALLAGLTGSEAQVRKLRTATAVLSQATGSLEECVHAICTQARELLNCEEACIYVSVHGVTAEGLATSEEKLYRLLSSEPSPEERAACDLMLYGVAACEVAASDGLASACLKQPKQLLRADRGQMDRRYVAVVDRLPGRAPPADLLYLDLSDAGGPLRAVLRVAHPTGAAPSESFAGRDEELLTDVLPLFRLALRFPVRRVAADFRAQRRAMAMRAIGECLAAMPELTRQAGLNGIVAAFSSRAATLLDAEGCVLYTLEDDGGRSALVALPPSPSEEPRVLQLEDRVETLTKGARGSGPLPCGILGLVATTRQLHAIPDCAADPRVNPDVDLAPGASGAPRSLLVLPVESATTGALLGVCEVVNKRGAGGDEAASGSAEGAPHFSEDDEVILYALLKTFGLAVENWQCKMDIEAARAKARRQQSTR